MSFVKDEGVYRCRLQLDDGHPCIDVIEHYSWNAEGKCLDESKPRGGLQIILRADAYKVLDNGELSTTCEEIALDNFGVTIITPTEKGEEVKHEVIANFVRIFGLKDASELLAIGSVDPEQLASAEFDCQVKLATAKNGKQYKNYWFTPAGQERQARAFVAPARNKATLDKYRSKLSVECKDIVGTPKAANKPASVPQRAKKPLTAAVGLLPRATANNAPQIDLNKVWDMWITANPDDTQGNEFYACIARMYGDRDATTLNAYELSAFCKANNLSVTPSADDEDNNLPY